MPHKYWRKTSTFSSRESESFPPAARNASGEQRVPSDDEKRASRSETATTPRLVQEFPAFLWDPQVHRRIHNSPPTAPIPKQT
jgi:hypothetical protein